MHNVDFSYAFIIFKLKYNGKNIYLLLFKAKDKDYNSLFPKGKSFNPIHDK